MRKLMCGVGAAVLAVLIVAAVLGATWGIIESIERLADVPAVSLVFARVVWVVTLICGAFLGIVWLVMVGGSIWVLWQRLYVKCSAYWGAPLIVLALLLVSSPTWAESPDPPRRSARSGTPCWDTTDCEVWPLNYCFGLGRPTTPDTPQPTPTRTCPPNECGRTGCGCNPYPTPAPPPTPDCWTAPDRGRCCDDGTGWWDCYDVREQRRLLIGPTSTPTQNPGGGPCGADDECTGGEICSGQELKVEVHRFCRAPTRTPTLSGPILWSDSSAR